MASREIDPTEIELNSQPAPVHIARSDLETSCEELRAVEYGQEFSLPEADGGKEAWLFLASCFMVEAMVWGFPFSFGLFQEYYSSHEPFSLEPNGIAAIGTSATGIMYLSSPLMFAFLQQWPRLRPYAPSFGLAILAVSLIASSFANMVTQLLLTQGVLYAVGGLFLYCPTLLYLDEWFVRRKGLAYGIMWAGTGLSGVIMPFLMNWGLERYGFRKILRIWAVALVIGQVGFLRFVKPRTPFSASSLPRRFNFRFLRSQTFWILELGTIAQGLGYFIPGIYLPTYARSAGLSPVDGTVLVALANAASVLGTILLGTCIDRFHVTTVILISTVGATLSVFFLWGLSVSLPGLCIFSLVYGLFAGGYSITNSGVVKVFRSQDRSADAGMILGFLGAGRGIGNVIAGPLSAALLASDPLQGKAELGYGTGYGVLILFTGIATALGGIGFLGKRVGWM